MIWSRDFTALLLQFAARVSAVGGIAQEEALLDWSPLYLNLKGLNRSFDPLAPTWRELVAGIQGSDSPVEWAHSFYLEHVSDDSNPVGSCFSWSYEEPTRTVRFHFFGNRDTSGYSPISEARRAVRLRELAALLAEVRRSIPGAEAVRGRSWLYNLPQYCRLFPPEYVRTAVAVEPELQFMSLWGQFFDRRGRLRIESARLFLENIARANTLDSLRRSFPLPVRAPRCAVGYFYQHYCL